MVEDFSEAFMKQIIEGDVQTIGNVAQKIRD